MSNHAEDVVAAVERLKRLHGVFIAEMPFEDVIILIAQIQLALRHPGNTGYSSQRARKIIEAMIAMMERSEPAVGPLLRMGFDPQHDVPR